MTVFVLDTGIQRTHTQFSGAKTVGTDPTITGVPFVGVTLRAMLHWSPTPTTLTYQWKRNGVPIVAATNATHLVTGADLGQSIMVTVAGSRPVERERRYGPLHPICHCLRRTRLNIDFRAGNYAVPVQARHLRTNMCVSFASAPPGATSVTMREPDPGGLQHGL